MLNLQYCTSKDSLFFPVTVELVLTQSRNWFTDFPYIKDMRTEIVTMWLHLAVALCLPQMIQQSLHRKSQDVFSLRLAKVVWNSLNEGPLFLETLTLFIFSVFSSWLVTLLCSKSGACLYESQSFKNQMEITLTITNS